VTHKHCSGRTNGNNFLCWVWHGTVLSNAHGFAGKLSEERAREWNHQLGGPKGPQPGLDVKTRQVNF